MRVIAGTARSLPLKCIEGLETRPTTDRIKETLFNILQPEMNGCRFLDLFAGSGAIGIEALSRGAKEAVFVESNRKAAACIRPTGNNWRRRRWRFFPALPWQTKTPLLFWRRPGTTMRDGWSRTALHPSGSRHTRPISICLLAA